MNNFIRSIFVMGMLGIAACGIAKPVPQKFTSMDKALTVIEECEQNSGGFCSYYYKNNKAQKTLIVNDVKQTPITWVQSKANLTISLGSYDTLTFIIDANRGIFLIEDLVSIDQQGECFVRADHQGIYFGRLFSQPKTYTRVIKSNDRQFDFMQTATLLSVIDGSFMKNGDFELSYMTEAGDERTKRIIKPCGN